MCVAEEGADDLLCVNEEGIALEIGLALITDLLRFPMCSTR